MTRDLRWRSNGTLGLAALLLLYVLLSVKRSEVKPLWFDELGTLNVATQPTLGQMFRVEPADGNPPLQYLLVRSSLHLSGHISDVSAWALRLPGMLSLGLALVCAYVFVGRRFGAAAALLAPALLLVSRVSDYGVEARPYGLLMGLTMLALVLWQSAAAGTDERRVRTLVGLAAAVFCLVLAQPMGVLWAAIPLFAGEAARWWRTRRVDPGVLLAIVAGLAGFAITLGFGRATQGMLSAESEHSHSAIALPTVGKFLQAFEVEGLLPAVALLVLLGLAALWVAWGRKKTDAERRTAPGDGWIAGAPAHEWVAVAAFALTVFAVFFFTKVVTHYFWARYIVPGAIGWFVLVGMTCGAVGRRAGVRKIVAAVLVVGVCLIGVERRAMVASTASGAGSQDSVTPSLLAKGDPSLPIVIGKPFFFPQIWWYSTPALRARLHFLADAPMASRTTDFVPEMTLIAMHKAGSTLFAPDSLTGFLKGNRRFLLWHHYVVQGCWLEEYLRNRHYSFRVVASNQQGDETLYEVTAPAVTP